MSVLVALLLGVMCFSLTVQAADQAPVRLQIYGNWLPSDVQSYEAFQRYLREYEALNPHVTIEDLGREHDTSKLLTMLVTGTAPDLIAAGTLSIANFFEQGLLDPVPEHFAERMRNELYPVAVQASQLHGAAFGIPAQNNVTSLYYNRYLLGALGLPQTAPQTWDELAATARRAMQWNDDGTIARAGLIIHNEPWALDYIGLAMLKSFGGSVVDGAGNIVLDNDPFHRLISYFEEGYENFYRLGYVQFSQGISPFIITFSYHVSALKQRFDGDYLTEVGVARLPAGPGGQYAVQYGNTYGVPKDSPNKEEVWKLLEWLYFEPTEQGMTRMGHVFALRGYPPVHFRDIQVISDFQEAPFLLGFINNLTIAFNAEAEMRSAGIQRWRFGQHMRDLLAGVITPVDVVQNVILDLRQQQAEYREAQAQRQ